MASNRISRINEEIQRQLSADIRRLKDPRVSGSGMVSVTRVDTTGDLRYARIYVSVLDKSQDLHEIFLLLCLRVSSADTLLIPTNRRFVRNSSVARSR